MEKRILFFFVDKRDEEFFDFLKTVLEDYYIDKTCFIEEAKDFFEKNSYEFVIVDFTKQNGKELLYYINDKNPYQRVVTMSDNYECSEPKDCDFCIKKYNKRRIFKPLNIKEVLDIFKYFDEKDCLYMNKFNNILDLLEKIVSELCFYNYDKEKRIICVRRDVSQSLVIEELIEVTDLLQKNNIKFRVDEYYNIELV